MSTKSTSQFYRPTVPSSQSSYHKDVLPDHVSDETSADDPHTSSTRRNVNSSTPHELTNQTQFIGSNVQRRVNGSESVYAQNTDSGNGNDVSKRDEKISYSTVAAGKQHMYENVITSTVSIPSQSPNYTDNTSRMIDTSHLQLGAQVVVELLYGPVMNGELFLVDTEHLRCIILKDDKSSQVNRGCFSIIQLGVIHKITIRSYTQQPVTNTLPACDLNVLEKRERRAIEEFEKRKHLIGVNVTKEAQEIFDFIHNTHPRCSWNTNGDITVLDITVPHSKYDHCIGPEGQTLERMREVLKNVRQRIYSQNVPTATSVPLSISSRLTSESGQVPASQLHTVVSAANNCYHLQPGGE